MSDIRSLFFAPADSMHIKREKARARELRATQWWRNQLGQGICHYCQNKFGKDELTMDHVVPIIRGGKSTKSNVVVSCKSCNSQKMYWTPVELTLQELSGNSTENNDN